MNMHFQKIVIGMMMWISTVACDQSADEEQQAGQNSANTNTAESPLTVPANPTQTTSGSLQDIWVLDSINNKAPDSNQFTRGTPYFDLNLDKKTISGHTGCNSLNGKLKVQGEKIRFDSLVVAKEVCSDKGFEKKLLSGFRTGNTTYKIINDKLHLNVGAGSEFIFRRIRR
jgi:heat shock protein HslJ